MYRCEYDKSQSQNVLALTFLCNKKALTFWSALLRMEGLEPTRLAAYAPETYASAYSATSASVLLLSTTLGYTMRCFLSIVNFSSSLNRPRQGALVGVFDVAAGGHTLGDAAQAQVFAGELADEVEGGGFTFNAGVEGEDDFFDGFCVDAGEQFFDVQFVRPDAVHWADDAAEDVVEAVVGTAVLDGVDVTGFFDNTQTTVVALFAHADGAEVGGGEVEAAFAVVNTVTPVVNGTGKGVAGVLRLLQEVVGEAFGAAAADAGQAREGVNHFADGVLIGLH